MEYLPLIIFAITYTTALVASWIQLNLKIKEIEIKVIRLIKDVSENEMDTLNKIDGLNALTNNRIEKIENKIDNLEVKVDNKLDIIINKLNDSDKLLTILNTEHRLNQCSFNRFVELLENKLK